jgi:methionine synthase II (cobalamin-independent)
MMKSPPITIPTEPIGNIPRPVDLIERVSRGESEDTNLAPLYKDAVRDTVERSEAAGSAPVDPHIETPEEVRDRVIEASEYVPIEQPGTSDDCGFPPFSDDTSTNRDTSFAKIQARVLGTRLAEKLAGGR